MKSPPESKTQQIYHERILKVLIYIQHHLSEDLRLEGLACRACFSPFHFHRLFRAMVGESVAGHIRRLRLERAAGRLRQTRMPIVHVALEAGYETHEAFTRAFGKMFGLAPSVYRRQGNAEMVSDDALIHFSEGRDIVLQFMQSGDVAMDVKVESCAAMKVVFVRHTGPYQECHHAWKTLCEWAGPKGLLGPQAKCLGISYDDPDVTPAEKIRYDACITVDDAVAGEGEIGVQEIPAGDYALAVHKGPYEELHRAYGFLYGQWLPQSGYQCNDFPPLEVYLNDPSRTPPQELLTEIRIPVRKL